MPHPAPDAPTTRIRPAEPGDVPDIHRLIHDLAAYEREPQSCTSTTADLTAALFPADRDAATFALVAEVAEVAQVTNVAEVTKVAEVADTATTWRVTGMALWFLSFSTWTGRHGIWLEDLYVEPRDRRRGLGKALLVELARIAQQRGYTRVEWWVLDWNTPSIEFYRALGAVAQDEWTTYRVDQEALTRLADG